MTHRSFATLGLLLLLVSCKKEKAAPAPGPVFTVRIQGVVVPYAVGAVNGSQGLARLR